MNGITDNILNTITLSRLTGPIFDKELRVLSRRKRYYFLRTIYLFALTALTAIIWTTTILFNQSNSALFQASRMSIAGIFIVSTIAWFQFIVTQLLAAVMLSNAISEEIHKNTLAVLMTTPITGFQIVVGKILSKLLLVILLLSVSFPLLAIVRLFGGIPWGFVVASFCITITAALFTASLSLLLSIFTRKTHTVIIMVIFILAILYGALPAAASLIPDIFDIPNTTSLLKSVFYFNPFAVMGIYTQSAVTSTAPIINIDWIAHCAIMIAASVILILLSVIAVSKARFHSTAGASRSSRSSKTSGSFGKIRPVKGSPIIWKESLTATSRKKRILKIAGTVLAIIAIISAYVFCITNDALDSQETHVAFIVGYFFLALLRIAIVSAPSITSEKESRTWPILLSTPLDKRDIIKGKIIAAIKKSSVFWILIALHLTVFTSMLYIHPLALIPLAILFAVSAVATASIGVFISSCCKRTSIAAAINLVVFFVCIVPVCCINPLPFIGPITLAGLIVAAAVNLETFPPLNFMADVGIKKLLISIAIFTTIMLIYIVVSYVSYVIAQSNVRRKIF